MKGLLKKDFYQFIQSRYIFIIAAFYIFAIFSRKPFLVAYSSMMISILPISMMTRDEVSRWQQFSLSLPFDRKDFVSAKYLLSLLTALAAMFFVSLGMCILNMINGTAFSAGDLSQWLMQASVSSLLIPAIMYPIYFRFGTVKGRYIFLALMFVCSALIGGLSGNAGETAANTAPFFLSDSVSANTSALLAIAFLAVLLFISWRLSVLLYRSREF